MEYSCLEPFMINISVFKLEINKLPTSVKRQNSKQMRFVRFANVLTSMGCKILYP